MQADRRPHSAIVSFETSAMAGSRQDGRLHHKWDEPDQRLKPKLGAPCLSSESQALRRPCRAHAQAKSEQDIAALADSLAQDMRSLSEVDALREAGGTEPGPIPLMKSRVRPASSALCQARLVRPQQLLEASQQRWAEICSALAWKPPPPSMSLATLQPVP